MKASKTINSSGGAKLLCADEKVTKLSSFQNQSHAAPSATLRSSVVMNVVNPRKW
jgi:hypothetical protein